MSTLYPLTTGGVQDLMNELYALPQPDLQLEANAIGSDFRQWVKNHFELSESQEEYLDYIDESWVEDAATESKHFLENRLLIALYKDQARRSEDKDRGKLLDLDKKKVSSYSEDDGYVSSETLTYTISYDEQQQ